jgi:hypothetical protein
MLTSGHRIRFSTLEPAVTRLLNVRYVISSRDPPPLPADVARERFRDGAVRIYEMADWLPRAYLVHRAEIIADEGAILRRVTSPEFRPRETVVLEAAGVRTANAPPTGDAVTVVRYGTTRVELQAESAADGMLVLADTYYPGWRAFVDGVEMPVYRADWALRAVAVPAGRHRVEFSYVPTGFGAGLAASAAGLMMTASLLLIGWGRRSDEKLTWTTASPA